MKLKKGFVLKKIKEKYYAVPVGHLAMRHRILICMNETCLFVWERLQQETTASALLDAITSQYWVERAAAEQDLHRFLTALRSAELLEE